MVANFRSARNPRDNRAAHFRPQKIKASVNLNHTHSVSIAFKYKGKTKTNKLKSFINSKTA